ncbi:hypothetical protein BKA56DRAFT_482328 [Ilyonectria sp. MPI-CAGE-AT-0026]|nr:hypothetical protein BKA56DRAFT_482328 [Ilyonectria sp. MPI-CAGE-AT-0026]
MSASSAPRGKTTTKDMWEAIKEYFGDGHVVESSPLRFNLHMCDMKGLSASANSSTPATRYGVEIIEEAMPLYSILGGTSPPPCTCFDMALIDYVIISGKDDGGIDETCLYIMRDTLSWWVHWTGSLRPGDYWKQIYVAFAAIPDDLQAPPVDFLDGSFRFLGHSWEDCRQGLLGEGVSPAQVEFAEMCLWRQMLTQYLEKVDVDLLPMLRGKTSVMTQYRVHTANTLGCAALVLASEGIESLRVEDNELEAASIAQCLSMDMAKEALGILQGERTETVAGHRIQLKSELRWVYVRCMDCLNSGRNAHILRRFSSAGLHYVPMMDRYLERVRGNKRFPISEGQARILTPFVKLPAVLVKGKELLHGGQTGEGRFANIKMNVAEPIGETA